MSESREERSVEEKRKWSLRHTAIYYLIVVSAVAVLGFIYSTVIAAILTGLFGAYLVGPHFERKFKNSKFRLLGAIYYTFSLIFFSTLLISILSPLIVKQANMLIQYFPKTLNLIKSEYYPGIQTILDYLGIKDINSVHFDEIMNLDKLSDYTQTGLSNIWRLSGSIIELLININLMPVLFGFFLYYWKDIKIFLDRFTPYPLKYFQDSYLFKIDQTIREIIKGQIMVAAVMGCLYALGFTIIGLKAGVLIGLICGICRLVPYADVVTAVSLASLTIFQNSASPAMFLAAGIVILVVQIIDGAILTPRIVGGRVGVHPILVIISILSFGDRFGIWGVILAIPFIAVLRVSWEFIAGPYENWLSQYRRSSLS